MLPKCKFLYCHSGSRDINYDPLRLRVQAAKAATDSVMNNFNFLLHSAVITLIRRRYRQTDRRHARSISATCGGIAVAHVALKTYFGLS